MHRLALLITVLWLLPLAARATVVDASRAEELYKSGDFKAAREEFSRVVAEFGAASKDSNDYRSYRELAYYYDRLADCCFTQRDWPALKMYLDGLLEVTQVEKNLVESQLTGALASGVARSAASYLVDRADESARLGLLAQLKRSIGLVLLDNGGEGPGGRAAIHQYQLMAAALVGVIEVDEGYMQLNIARLEQDIDKFDSIHQELRTLADLAKLWEKYPLQGDTTAEDGNSEPAGESE
jgi:tetratricopeptide (TPR) repeat protein